LVVFVFLIGFVHGITIETMGLL